MASPTAVFASAQALVNRINPLHTLVFASEVLEAPPDDSATSSSLASSVSSEADAEENPWSIVEGDRVAGTEERNRVQVEGGAAGRRYLALVRAGDEGCIIIFRRATAPIIVHSLPILESFELSISQKHARDSPTSAVERSRFRITFHSTLHSSYFSFLTESISDFSPLVTAIKSLQAYAREHHLVGPNPPPATSASASPSPAPTPTTDDPSEAPAEPTTASAEEQQQQGRRSHTWVAKGYSVAGTKVGLRERGKRESLSVNTGASSDTLSKKLLENGLAPNVGEAITTLRTGLSSLSLTPSPRTPGSYSRIAHESALEASRSAWVQTMVNKRWEEWMGVQEVKIWCGTWNVNDRLPTQDSGLDLGGWLAGSEDAEVLVFGFQEFDLSTEAMVRYTSYREDLWRWIIESTLSKRDGPGKWVKVQSKQNVTTLLLIYVRKDVEADVEILGTGSVNTGLLGYVANKGAVGIRMRYKSSIITFINSHLAAFTSAVVRRNQETKDIAKFMHFGVAPEGVEEEAWKPDLKKGEERPLVGGVPGIGIWDCHQLIWIGDLNYRLELPRSDVLRMIESKEWELLSRFDQLKIQKQYGLAWTDFNEAPLNFPPTFKFDPGTYAYDTSEKQRTPSWTDRVLWMSEKDDSVRCLRYGTALEIGLSDHKPVGAVLGVQVMSIVKEKRDQCQEEVMAELDIFDNDQLPDLKILPSPAVQFDTISYLSPAVHELEVKNVGRVIAQWSFVLKPSTTTLCLPWLTLSQTSGLLLPGESSNITLTININSTIASDLNFTVDPVSALSDLLVLSIEKKDLFIAIQARDYERTCFGNSLLRLAELNKPIRTATPEQLERVVSGKVGAGSMPHEVIRMVGFLAEYGTDVEGLFLIQGDEGLVRKGDDFPLDVLVRTNAPPPASASTASSALKAPGSVSLPTPPSSLPPSPALSSDIGTSQLSPTLRPPTPSAPPGPPPIPVPIPRNLSISSATREREDVGIYSVADCFLRFFDSLPEPVVTFEAYEKALRVQTREDAYRVVDSLPTVNTNTLLYLISFLRVIIGRTIFTEARISRTDRLAVVFSSVLLRAPPAGAGRATAEVGLAPASIPKRRKDFVLFLLADEGDGPGVVDY